MTAIRKLPLKNGWLRVLGIDPAAVGPTGYGIIDSDGRAIEYKDRNEAVTAIKAAAGIAA